MAQEAKIYKYIGKQGAVLPFLPARDLTEQEVLDSPYEESDLFRLNLYEKVVPKKPARKKKQAETETDKED